MATNHFGSKLTSPDLKAGRASSYPPVSLSSFGFPDVPLTSATPETIFAEEKSLSLDLGDTLADMNRWADQRVAIFASLDAALSKAVVEAASALSELKQQTENEARLTTMIIVSERERLQRQVEDLRLERVRLQDQLTEVRREIEAEQTHKLGVEREAQAVLATAERDRDRVQVEVNQLSQQMDAMGQQLQTFFQQRFAELWEQFSKSVSPTSRLKDLPVPSVEQVFGDNFDPAALWANNAPPVTLEPAFETLVQPALVPDDATEIKAAVTLQQFEDAATPKPNTQPLAPAPSVVTIPTLVNVQLFTPAPAARVGETVPKSEKVVFNESEIELDESDFLKIFQTSTPASKTDIVAAESSPVTPVKAVNGQSNTRQTQARQRIERLMSKRSSRVARIGSQPTQTDTHRRRALRDRQAFDEIGAKLGLGTVVTPPPFDDILFAEGFTPPPEVSNFLLRMTVGESRTVAPTANKPSNAISDPTDAGTIRLEDIFTQIPADLPFEAVGDEAMAVNWDAPSPSIGELGPDFAQHWYDDAFSAAPSPLIEKLAQAEAIYIQPAPDPDPLLPPIRPSRSYTPLSDSIFGNWPNVSVLPPPLKVASETEQKSGIVSKVYVSNLQGLALLTIEKVLRGLPGVYQVIVTTLEKGEIGMEVRHHTELKLDKVLPNLPDFRLKLVEHNQNVLKFIQMR